MLACRSRYCCMLAASCCPSASYCSSPPSRCCSIPQLREQGLCSHGQGTLGIQPKRCHGGEGEAHGKPAVSSGGLKHQPLAPHLLQHSSQAVKVFLPWGSGSGELGGQSREMVRAQPGLQHQCLPLPAPAMSWAMQARDPAQHSEQHFRSPTPRRPSLGSATPTQTSLCHQSSHPNTCYASTLGRWVS